jgi:hypothetical protein
MNYAPFYPSHVCMLIHSVVLGSIDRVCRYMIMLVMVMFHARVHKLYINIHRNHVHVMHGTN